MADLSRVGFDYATGKAQEDRRIALQQADIQRMNAQTMQNQQNLAAAKAGYQMGAQGQYEPIPGSEAQMQQEQNMILMNEINNLKNQKVQKETWDTLDSAFESNDVETINKYINRPDVKPLFNQMGIQSYEKFDPTNKSHMDMITREGVNPDFLAELAKAREDSIITDEELDSIQRAYPVARQTDGTLTLDSLENMVMMTGRAKATHNTKTFNDMMDTIAQGKEALNGVTSRLFQAKQIAGEAQAEVAEIQADTMQLEFDDMKKYLAENPDATLADYEAQKKAKSITDTAEMQNIKFEADKRGVPVEQVIEERNARKENRTKSKLVQKEEFQDEQDLKILDKAGVTEFFDVDYDKLDKNTKLQFNQRVANEVKDLSKDDKDKVSVFNAVRDASKKINVEKLERVTGLVDATAASLMDTLGIDRDLIDVGNETQMAVVRNIFVKMMSGSQVTGNEWERLKAQLGTNFKADATASAKLGNALQEIITSVDRLKSTAPAYYAKWLRPSVANLNRVAGELKGEPTQTPTRAKVTAGARVKGPDGKIYVIDENGKPQLEGSN